MSLIAASLPVGFGLLFLALDGSADGGGTSDFLEEVFFLTISFGGETTTVVSSTSLPNKSNGFCLNHKKMNRLSYSIQIVLSFTLYFCTIEDEIEKWIIQ